MGKFIGGLVVGFLVGVGMMAMEMRDETKDKKEPAEPVKGDDAVVAE